MVVQMIARAVDTEEISYSLREVRGAVGVFGGVGQVGEVALLQLLRRHRGGVGGGAEELCHSRITGTY